MSNIGCIFAHKLNKDESKLLASNSIGYYFALMRRKGVSLVCVNNLKQIYKPFSHSGKVFFIVCRAWY